MSIFTSPVTKHVCIQRRIIKSEYELQNENERKNKIQNALRCARYDATCGVWGSALNFLIENKTTEKMCCTRCVCNQKCSHSKRNREEREKSNLARFVVVVVVQGQMERISECNVNRKRTIALLVCTLVHPVVVKV